jgi:hypothetical protein
LLQIGLYCFKQYYERRKETKDISILSYGFYFVFLAVGSFIYFYIITHDMPTQIFEIFLFSSVVIRGLGGILFSFIVELNMQQMWRTRYAFSACLIALLVLIPFVYNTLLFYPIVNGMNVVFFLTPLLYTIFFVKNAYGAIRQKLIIVICGFFFNGLGSFFILYSILELIKPLQLFPYLFFSSRLIAIFGIGLIWFGFYGYSFSMEFQWRDSLISLIIVDKMRNICLYYKNFLASKLKNEQLLAEGIPGIVDVIKEITDSQMGVDVINMGNRLLLLEHGKKVITALLVKRNLYQLRYALKQISAKFEIFFWDYLIQYESYSAMTSHYELFKPMEILIRSILKL